MRIFLDDTAVTLDVELVADALERQLPAFITDGDAGAMDAKERALRLGVKATMRALLATIDKEIVTRRLPLPRPTVPRKADPLAFGANYLLALLLLGLDAMDWQASYVEGEDGSLAITGVAARTGARDRGETAATGAAPGDAGGAAREPTGPLACPGDDELRQDDIHAPVSLRASGAVSGG